MVARQNDSPANSAVRRHCAQFLRARILVCGMGAILAGCASSHPSSFAKTHQPTPESQVNDLIQRGKCDDAWFFALHSGSEQLIQRVDSTCRLNPEAVAR
jgi:hypothetical protein